MNRQAAALGLLLLPLAAAVARGQVQYQGLPFPSYEIFEALVSYAREGNLRRIEKALPHLAPLFAALPDGAALRERLRGAAAARDREAARKAVAELLFDDLCFNLAAAEKAPGARMKELLQLAFIDYHFLSPWILASDPDLDRAARAAFREAYRTGNPAPLAARREPLAAALGLRKAPEGR